MVLLLLLLGAKPSERTYLGETALMAAEASFARHPDEKVAYQTIRHALDDPEWAMSHAAELYGRRLADAIRANRTGEADLLCRLGIKAISES